MKINDIQFKAEFTAQIKILRCILVTYGVEI